MTSSSIVSILDSLHALHEPIHVSGLTQGARALMIAEWFARTDSETPLLVICESNEAMARLADEIETLSECVLGRTLRPETFPGWDHSPYSSIAPALSTRFQRIATLNRLAAGTNPIVLTTLSAALYRTLPLSTLSAHSFFLDKKASSSLDRDRLIESLLEAGYLRVDPVEDPGTFALRGDLVDVYPPEFHHPIRIEFWGDEIETIRSFDPTTQRTRTEEPFDEIRFGPAREVLINSKTTPALRERLKTRADDEGVPRASRDPLLQRVHPGSYPEVADFWAGFAYGESAKTFLELFPWSRVAVVDSFAIEREWDSWISDQKEREKEALASGIILPALSSAFQIEVGSLETMPVDRKLFLDSLEIADLSPKDSQDEASSDERPVEDAPKSRHRVFVRENRDLYETGTPSFAVLESKITLWKKQGFKTLVLCSTPSQMERVRHLLEERGVVVTSPENLAHGTIALAEGSLERGFRWPAEGLVILTDSEILGTQARHRSKRKRKADESAAKEWSNLNALSDLSPGDAVVHIDHGIGRYSGIVRLDADGVSSEFLLIEYAKGDKLYLPVYRLNAIQKHMGGSGETIALDQLGGTAFAKAKEKAKQGARAVAFDLVQLYAQRKIQPGIQFSPRDAEMSRFEASFPFDETPDQLKAIDAVLNDMESGRVMDRLICGDVGYGKTEVAIRAAFKAVYEGYQVAVLVPTTVLAHQHEQSFRARFSGEHSAVRIESVSRFKTPKQRKEILQSVKDGSVDIVIGTHRLLSSDVSFKSLALVIIDEEHRFGVEHKEKLKTLRMNAHVLAMTATPIPRTLHMALSGLRDISLINTPPIDRLPIRTYVSKFDEDVIRRAIETELNRGGQVFFIHNRVRSIGALAEKTRELVPRAKVAVAHGQMSEAELEKVMMGFYEKTSDVLIATSIIESGIDVPSANTILIDRADAFGLAQLYQLRGRVGRARKRAYAYLFIPAEGAISEDAKKRLEVIQRFVELGSGFSVASHDLEIRGGGDILGAEQSGHINAIGYELYAEILDEAIRELQGKPIEPESSRREPEIKIPFSALLPENYTPDPQQRLALYRRLSGAENEERVDEIEVEMRDRFGKLPEEASNLIWLIRVKLLLKNLRIDALTVGPERIVLVPAADSAVDPIRAIALMAAHNGKYVVTPDSKFVAKVKILSIQALYHEVSSLFRELSFRD